MKGEWIFRYAALMIACLSPNLGYGGRHRGRRRRPRSDHTVHGEADSTGFLTGTRQAPRGCNGPLRSSFGSGLISANPSGVVNE